MVIATAPNVAAVRRRVHVEVRVQLRVVEARVLRGSAPDVGALPHEGTRGAFCFLRAVEPKRLLEQNWLEPKLL